MKFPERAKNVIRRELPELLIKKRELGYGKSKVTLSYISGATVVDLLNEAFDYLWDWQVDKEWIQESVDRYDKNKGEYQPQNPVAHVRGKLTVYLPQEDGGSLFQITKSGHGSKPIIGGQNEQESSFKSADTDALKKAASRLGIGLSLYRDEEEQLFFEESFQEEGPWTDEALEKYSEEHQYLLNFIEKNDIRDDLASYVKSFNKKLNDIEDITPDNIEEFVEFLKKEEQKQGVEV